MCFKGTNPSKTCFCQEDRPQVEREKERDRQRLIIEDFILDAPLNLFSVT